VADPTRLDPSSLAAGGATRLDAQPSARPPVHEAQRRLPAELAARFEVSYEFPAGGAEADVYRVRQREDGVQRVLKVYREGLHPKREVLERLARLRSPFVVESHELGEANGRSYELLEYARYGNLRNLMRATGTQGASRGATVPVAVRELVHATLLQLHGALTQLHELDIVHRDLKPENVLVRNLEPLQLALTDFGTSSVLEASQRVTQVARTLRYGAPEASSGAIGRPVDWWALGMMTLEIATGRHPYEALPDAAVLREQLTRDVDVSGVADERLRALCGGLLHRDPELRWGAAQVGRWLAGEDVAPPAASAQAGISRPAARPYSFRGEHLDDVLELARVFASHRAEAVKHWRRGFVVTWLRDQLRDPVLADFAASLAASEPDPEHQVLRFIQRVDSRLPLLYEGLEVTPAELDALAIQALALDRGATTLLASIVRADVLRFAPDPALVEASRRLRSALPSGTPREESETAIVRAYAQARGMFMGTYADSPVQQAPPPPPAAGEAGPANSPSRDQLLALALREAQVRAFADAAASALHRARQGELDATASLQHAWARIALPDDAPYAADVAGLLTRLLAAEKRLREMHERARDRMSRGRSILWALLHGVAIVAIALASVLGMVFLYGALAWALASYLRKRRKRLVSETQKQVITMLGQLREAAHALSAEYAAGRDPEVDRLGGSAALTPVSPSRGRLLGLAALPLPVVSTGDPILQAQADALAALQASLPEAGDHARSKAEAFRDAHRELRLAQVSAFADAAARAVQRAKESEPDATASLQLAWTRIALPDDAPYAADVAGLLTRMLVAENLVRETHEHARNRESLGPSLGRALFHTVGVIVLLPAACGLHTSIERDWSRYECGSYFGCGAFGLVFFLFVLFAYVGLGWVLPWSFRRRRNRLISETRKLVATMLGQLHDAARALSAEYAAGRDPEIDRLGGGT
jgi:hypothetical protein